MGLEFLSVMMEIFWNLTVLMVVKLCVYIKYHCIVHFSRVNFIVFEFYPNKSVVKKNFHNI